MRMRFFLVLSLLLLCLGNVLADGQQASTENTRPIIRKVQPVYPEVAKRMNLAGTVKLLATVAPNGTVKALQPMGGSPILVQSAEEAVYKWQFATASSETKEPIEIHFSPQ
jgi:TonB family protein